MEGADGALHFLFFFLLEAIKIIFLAHMHFFLYLCTLICTVGSWQLTIYSLQLISDIKKYIIWDL